MREGKKYNKKKRGINGMLRRILGCAISGTRRASVVPVTLPCDISYLSAQKARKKTRKKKNLSFHSCAAVKKSLFCWQFDLPWTLVSALCLISFSKKKKKKKRGKPPFKTVSLIHLQLLFFLLLLMTTYKNDILLVGLLSFFFFHFYAKIFFENKNLK